MKDTPSKPNPNKNLVLENLHNSDRRNVIVITKNSNDKTVYINKYRLKLDCGTECLGEKKGVLEVGNKVLG